MCSACQKAIQSLKNKKRLAITLGNIDRQINALEKEGVEGDQ
jgi:hypothetical protein